MHKSAGRTVLSVLATLAIGSTLLTLLPATRVSGFGPCPLNCSGAGVCDFNASVCTCNPCSSGSGCEIECSGNGTCLNSSTTTGFCSCNAGYSGPQCGTAAQCSAGSSSPTGTIPCTPCNPGTFSDTTGATNCSICAAGSFQASSGGTTCPLCGSGTYSGAGSSSCLPCDPGSFTNSSGSAFCQPCAAGSYAQSSGSSTCSSCAPGSATSSTGSTSCPDCNPGQFQPSSGESTCLNCGAGTYQPSSGSTLCLNCNAGTYQPAAASSTCLDCAAGTYQPSIGTTTCIGCAPGTFADTTGSSSCDTCTPACPAGQFESAACTATSDTGCAPCDATCLTCDGPSASECTSCESGNPPVPPVSGECLPGCTAAPKSGCRPPFLAGKAGLSITDNADNTKDSLKWKWIKGSATLVAEFGAVTGTEGLLLCVYDGTTRVSAIALPPDGTCAGKPCWKTKPTGYGYKDKDRTPNGVLSATLKAGPDGKALIKVTAKGANVPTPNPTSFTGPIVVQLQRDDGSAVCWEAKYTAPFKKNVGGKFSDKAD